MYTDILIPVDLGDDASWQTALPAAVEYARAFGATLHVMTVVPDFGMSIVGSFFPDDYEEKALAKASDRLHAFVAEQVPAAVPVQHIVGHGSIYAEILRVAREIGADLIVMGSHRPELKDYLLGPNAARVVRHAETSVLVVRG
ncbi:MAG: universal stress protein [Alphaproteobacteria bacterium]|jgi:nucleotide-binding universal stress UspA family protein|nr:universal stress protein [Alphaproteobacteria bacterium]